ncbi:MAG TPA: hypothetical protein VNQ78_09805 [Paracoccus sp. (in: a-proteobacteria)]|uniref:hypothetical protein n=1 Tax=Paracoccus sp. TaxID=267 RepID=UPI002D0F60AB|nr:hypothetical protein [Paracoccus sp. (in: a-proteobacteria)]HWL56952.1 hypothetical protein [Paracoccus sp. (in: a-proteobacteria)]
MRRIEIAGMRYQIDPEGGVWMDLGTLHAVTDPLILELVTMAEDGAGGATAPAAAGAGVRRGPRWLTEREMAERLGVSMSWLQKDRASAHPQVPFERFGRNVRYRVED